MSGIVNSTGAVSGVIGTTVGTPAAGKVVWAGWDDSHNQTSSAAPVLDGSLVAIDTDYATISTSTITIVKAGNYQVLASIFQHQNAVNGARTVKLIQGGATAAYTQWLTLPTGWNSTTLVFSNYMAATETLSFLCTVGTGDPYAWHSYNASRYSLAYLIWLGE